MSAMEEYWSALDRLKSGSPIRVPKHSSINKDTVALEAGRKRGSIKRSRSSFAELITAIDTASEVLSKKAPSKTAQLQKERSKTAHYRELYHESLNRELMLIERIAQLEKELRRFDNVIQIAR